MVPSPSISLIKGPASYHEKPINFRRTSSRISIEEGDDSNLSEATKTIPNIRKVISEQNKEETASTKKRHKIFPSTS